MRNMNTNVMAKDFDPARNSTVSESGKGQHVYSIELDVGSKPKPRVNVFGGKHGHCGHNYSTFLPTILHLHTSPITGLGRRISDKPWRVVAVHCSAQLRLSRIPILSTLEWNMRSCMMNHGESAHLHKFHPITYTLDALTVLKIAKDLRKLQLDE